jgi:hypothetical protein
MLTISALSKEYVWVPVTVTEADGDPADPTNADVEIAFVPADSDPTDLDWLEAEWETVDTSYYAKVLVGPGSSIVTLEPDTTYDVYVRVSDSPERPVLRAAPLRTF